MAESGATAPSRRIPVKDRTPPYSADPWGASGNAPGSGTAELTKFEIPPDLGNDAGWRRRVDVAALECTCTTRQSRISLQNTIVEREMNSVP